MPWKWIERGCCIKMWRQRRQPSPQPLVPRLNLSPISPTHNNEPSVKEPVELNFSTWPEENLRNTAHKLLKECSVDSDEMLERIVESVNDTCPFELKVFDFCIICSEYDYPEASVLKKSLMERYNLTGCLVEEFVALGADLFDVYEKISKGCTKVIFYITQNFTEDGFCAHLSRNTFLSPGEKYKLKIVPIVEQEGTPVPEPLLLVFKLSLDKPLQFNTRFSAIFSEDVREETLERKNNFGQEKDKERLQLLQRLAEECALEVASRMT